MPHTKGGFVVNTELAGEFCGRYPVFRHIEQKESMEPQGERDLGLVEDSATERVYLVSLAVHIGLPAPDTVVARYVGIAGSEYEV